MLACSRETVSSFNVISFWREPGRPTEILGFESMKRRPSSGPFVTSRLAPTSRKISVGAGSAGLMSTIRVSAPASAIAAGVADAPI
jgi:hypothetical protein